MPRKCCNFASLLSLYAHCLTRMALLKWQALFSWQHWWFLAEFSILFGCESSAIQVNIEPPFWPCTITILSWTVAIWYLLRHCPFNRSMTTTIYICDHLLDLAARMRCACLVNFIMRLSSHVRPSAISIYASPALPPIHSAVLSEDLQPWPACRADNSEANFCHLKP